MNEHAQPKPGQINWTTTLFLVITTVVALTGAPLYVWHYGLDPLFAALFVFMFVATTMSVTLGYHRMWAHNAFKGRLPVRFLTAIFGACAFQNSVLDWTSDHRRHHKHVDHDDDPYNINKGFLWAHVGWLIFKRPTKTDDGAFQNVKDLLKSPLLVWQHKYVQLIAVVVGLIGPGILGFFWNGWVGALGGFLIVGVFRVVAVHHVTFFINSFCHCIGTRPYSSQHSARDSGLMAVLTMGEGYHNFHHSFQHDYRNGVKPWEFDPTKWMIWTLSKFGLTTDLRRVPAEKILLAEMQEASRKAALEREAELLKKCATTQSTWETASHALGEWIGHAGDTMTELENAIADRVGAARSTLARGREQIRELRAQTANLAQIRLAPVQVPA